MPNPHAPLIVLLSTLLVLPAATQDADSGEYEIKAAMIFNFVRFVEWPATAWDGPSAPVSVCVLGTDPVGAALDELLRGKSIAARAVKIRHLRAVEPAQACHVLYVAQSEKKRTAAILRALDGRPVLTVSASEKFVQDGGLIGFVTENDRVRFEIGAAAAARGNLVISAKLLKLAINVWNGPPRKAGNS